MERSDSAAAARKPLPVKSDLEAEISNLLDPEGQKCPAHIEDDGEQSGACRAADFKFDRRTRRARV